MKKINLAVIGSFWLSEEMIKTVNGREDVEYYAQYSRSLERAVEFGSKYGAKAFYDDLLSLASDENIDAVYVASPNALHYSQSKLLIEHGKHVICEKPITLTLREFNELCTLADENGVIIFEGMMNIHHPAAAAIKDMINGKKIVTVRFDFDQRSSKLERWKNGEKISTFEKSTLGGALHDLGVYVTSLVTYLFGTPADIFARAYFNDAGVDMKDTVVYLYDGFDIVCTISKLGESYARSEIILEEKTIQIGTLSRLDNVSCGDIRISGESSFNYCMNCELNDFISYIGGSREEYLKNREYTASSIFLLEKTRNKIGYTL